MIRPGRYALWILVLGPALVVGCGSDTDDDVGPDAGDPASDVRASEGCNGESLEAGDSTVEIMHDGVARDFLLHVPQDHDGSEPVPLVVDIHGYTVDGQIQSGISGWVEKADQEGFIVVHPNGLDDSWNGGELCCGVSLENDVDDEGFIRAVVDYMKTEACIDSRRVYATGLSNGGAMSHLLACRAADVFAATAPVAMGNGTEPCEPSRPISVVMFRGTQDETVPYDGGDTPFPSAAADLEQWKNLNGCTGEPVTRHEVCEAYTECDDGVEVMLCSPEAGHVTYFDAADQGVAIPDVTWDVFEGQTLP